MTVENRLAADTHSLTVVIPTFNEADNVEALVEQLSWQLREIDAEILFVDDSTDHTPTVILAVADSASLPVRLIHRDVPVGSLAGAVVEGLQSANAPWVVVMDGDLQHPPTAVHQLYEKAIASGSDVVVASRYMQGGDAGGLDGRLRRVVSRWSGRSAKTLFPRKLAGCSDPMSGFFAVRRDALELEGVKQSGYKVLLSLLLHRPLALAEVPFVFADRHAGESKASFKEGLRYLRLLATLRLTPGLLFLLVGASGVLPNLVSVAILTGAGVHYLIAAAIASQVAIAWNFAGAELLVFRDRRAGRLGSRAIRYWLLSETDLLRLPFVALLVEYAHLGTIVATAATLAAAVTLRYSLAAKLVYGHDARSTDDGRHRSGDYLTLPDPRPEIDLTAPAPVPDVLGLPTPPSDEERTLYFGPQHRWVAVSSFIGSLLVLGSIILFVVQRPWAAWLLIPVGLNIAGACISLLSSSRRRRYSYAEHQQLVADWQPDYIPSVDVFLPSAGEDLAVLENTYTHVKNLQWHGALSVQVMDDADRSEVRTLAEQYGFEYTVRADRGHLKKAGNLLAAYKRTDGDFILVLDADFVPRSTLLYDLLPYMDDPENGIVQSPQFFDVHKPSMSWVQHAAGATQVLFYRWIQPSRDRSNAAICVGTSAVYRREALDKAGGFAQIEHSEDVHTGVQLMHAGYRVRYVPIVVTKGLCPSGFDQFVTQQYRWCTGSMSLLFSRDFHRQKFSFMQRLSYWSGFLYFIGTGVNVFTLVIPPVLMGIFAPNAINPLNYALVVMALALRRAMIPIITLDKASMLSVMRVQLTYSFAHAVALFDVLRGRTDGWVATGQTSKSRTAERVGKLSRRWCVGVQAVLWTLLAVRFAQGYAVNFWPLAVLAAFNLFLVIPIVARRDVRGVS